MQKTTEEVATHCFILLFTYLISIPLSLSLRLESENKELTEEVERY